VNRVLLPQDVFPGGKNVVVAEELCDSACTSTAVDENPGYWLTFCLMDVVLERQLRAPRMTTKAALQSGSSVNKVMAASKADIDPCHDGDYRTAIAVVPDAGVFYSCCDRAWQGGCHQGKGRKRKRRKRKSW
jgi:hypothetical protein